MSLPFVDTCNNTDNAQDAQATLLGIISPRTLSFRIKPMLTAKHKSFLMSQGALNNFMCQNSSLRAKKQL